MTLFTTLFPTRNRTSPEATPRCAHCGTHTGHGSAVCRSCAEDARCTVCHAHLYRVSLLDGAIEPLDHDECALLAQAA